MKNTSKVLIFFIAGCSCSSILALTKILGLHDGSWLMISTFIWVPFVVVAVAIAIMIIGGLFEYLKINHKQVVSHIDDSFNDKDKDDAENN